MQTKISGSHQKTRIRERNLLDAPCVPYLISFFVPVVVMILIFIGKEIFPFGDRSFLRTDLYHQYAPFFQEYKDKLSNMESLFYTWDIGLGTNFIALYAYYLSSPLNWFLAVWPRQYVIEFITYGIVLRMALSSLSMTYYLNKRDDTHSIGSSFFGIFYGLSGYMAAYSWNIMWLDCLILFPLIILGLERLIKKDKCLLYCLTLALCIYSNYYISIMVCISLVLYFILQLFLVPADDYNYPKKVLNFALYSLLAGGIAAVMLIPEIAALSTTASGNFNFPDKAKSYFTIMDMLSRHLMNVNVEIGLDHWPNIYCGVAVLFFIPLYFMNKRTSTREKIAYLVLLLVFLLSFSLDVLNFIWHGFHYPNSLPCRQSFIYIFLVLTMCYIAYRDIKERSPKELLFAVCAAVGFIILAEKLAGEYTGVNADSEGAYYVWYSFYLSILFVVLYGGLSYVHVTAKHNWRGLLVFSAVCAILIESTINMAATSVTTVSRSTYVKNDETVRRLVSSAEEDEGENFFRVEKISNTTKNDGAWLDYHSASIFSSTAYADLTAIYKKFGLESSTNAYGTTGSSFASNMLLGIKYSLSFSTLEEDGLRTLYDSEIETNADGTTKSSAYLYRNTYALPLGFVTDSLLETNWNTTNVNPADNWNSLSLALGINDPLFVPITDIQNNDTTTVTVSTDTEGYVYLYVSKSGPNKVAVTSDAFSSAKKFSNLSRSYFLPLDKNPAGTVFTVSNDDDDKPDRGVNVSAYMLDEDVLSRVYDILNEEPLIISHYDSTTVSGTVTSQYGGTMFLSVPYDSGWTIYVDGEETTTHAFEDAFLSFTVPAGTHEIYMKYTPNGFWNGVLISLVSLILLGMICLLIRQWRISHPAKKESDFDENDEEWDEEEILSDDEEMFPDDEEVLANDADMFPGDGEASPDDDFPETGEEFPDDDETAGRQRSVPKHLSRKIQYSNNKEEF